MRRAALLGLLALAPSVVVTAWAPTARAQMERVTMDEAIARAMMRSADVLTAAAEVRRAEALLIQARAGAIPTVLPSATYTRLDRARVLGDRIIAAENQFSASVPITVPLVAPQPWAQWARASDTARVANMEVAEVRRQVALAVAYAYLTVLAQHRLVEVSEVARRAADAHARYAAQQFEGGRVSRLDVARAEQQLHVAAAQVETARVALVRAQEALGVLVAGDHPIDASSEPEIPRPRGDAQPEARRADLLAQMAAQEAALRSLRRSTAEFLPYLTGVFVPAFTDPATVFQPRWAWQLQLNLVVPLWDGGVRLGRQRERRALLDQSTLFLEGSLRQARSEVRVGREAVERAEARLREATQGASLAREALEISLRRYQEGATTNIEVIDAERQAREADLEAARAEDALRQAKLDLLAATGEFPSAPAR